VEATVKYRIIGSLILLSLAVIILPFWLDGAGLKDYQSSQQQQPAMPEVFDVNAAQSLDGINATENIDPSDQAMIELSPALISVESSTQTNNPTQVDKTEALNPSGGLLNQQGLPNGWVVQLGTFGNQSNAIRLKGKLIKAGFAAYIVPNDSLFKVLVGPELSRIKAETLQQQLKIKFKMTGMVTLYEVVKP
jgi:DedD protein